MSDARNSSNSLRGGGAKQTGGSGRTQKQSMGNKKSELLGQNGLRAHQERNDAKQKLQLQMTSKKLAASIKKALLDQGISEEEYAAQNIPLPSTEDAKKKLKSMKEFTEKWHDKEFREEWLETVTQVWLEELKQQYEEAVRAAVDAVRPPAVPVEETIEELTERIANLSADTPPEERQRLKKKLKRKKQRAKEREKAKAAESTSSS